jgi:alpha-amylase/alpha-mannosidase (GH57 family)
MGRKIQLAILWHMHQPPYVDPRGRYFLMPWTYLHGTKDYLDMGEVARRHPGMRINVNFTPSLLEQIAQYVDGSIPDHTLQVMCRDPGELTFSDQEFLLRTCFSIHSGMIGRFPRFRELHDRFRATGGERFEPADFLDLVVLFLLAWCGPVLSADPAIQEIAARGRNFAPADRDNLIAAGREHLARIVPLYKQLSESGIVELSTTPYNHPILPLLIGSGAGIASNPSTNLPLVRFEAPEEAERQVDIGLAAFEKTFGFRPRGMWPAEGAVSEQAVRLLASRGVQWIATDEEILRRSLGGEASWGERLRAWNYGGVNIFFRDHFLSDQIGFVYSRWPTRKAVAHFMAELRKRADAMDRDDGLVVVALDGENAWEFYENGGFPFLDELYTAIENSDFVEPVTLGEALDRKPNPENLDYLATGSWIDGELNTWIGDPAKNRAWSMLAAAWQSARDTGGLAPDKADRVRHLLLNAEASDWFWWFGKGHTSAHDREFDFLFRQNLRAIYEELGLDPPEQLERPVEPHPSRQDYARPTSCISPRLTGRLDGFYKWVGAGICSFSHGSIHRLDPIVRQVMFGYDRTHVYLRVDGFRPMRDALGPDMWLRIVFLRPCEQVLQLRFVGGRLLAGVTRNGNGYCTRIDEEVCFEVDDILEMAIPTSWFMEGTKPTVPFPLEFHFVFGTGDLEEERFPWDANLDMTFDPDGFALTSWFV